MRSDPTILPESAVAALQNAERCLNAAYRNPSDAIMYIALVELHSAMAREAIAGEKVKVHMAPPASAPSAAHLIDLSRTIRHRDHARRFTDADLDALARAYSSAQAAE